MPFALPPPLLCKGDWKSHAEAGEGCRLKVPTKNRWGGGESERRTCSVFARTPVKAQDFMQFWTFFGLGLMIKVASQPCQTAGPLKAVVAFYANSDFKHLSIRRWHQPLLLIR
jgi:hypothetical protein